MQQDKRYTAEVVEICENGDAIIELPPELCEQLGWKEGDTLEITSENNQILLHKIEK